MKPCPWLLSLCLLCWGASVGASQRFNPFTGKPDYIGLDIQTTDCSTYTTEGLLCWDTDNDTLCVGTGAACTTIGSGAGDITDVNEGTAIDVATPTGPAPTVSWDSTEVEATTWGAGGNASNVWTFNLSGTDPTLTVVSGGLTLVGTFIADTFLLNDGDVIDADGVTVNTTTEGILLPIYNAGGTAEGQISWDGTNDALFVGDASAATEMGISVFGSGTSNSSVDTFYLAPFFAVAFAGETDRIFELPAGLNCRFTNLHGQVISAPGAGTSWTVTLRDDAVATSLTCSIANTSIECDDATNAPTVAGASRVTVEFLEVGAAGTTGGSSFSVLCHPT